MAIFENKEKFLEWLNSEEGKSIAAPVIDSKVSNGINSYKQNHPDAANLAPRLNSIEEAIAAKELELKKKDKCLLSRALK